MSETAHTVPLKSLATITMGQSPDSSSVNANEIGLPFLQGCAEFGAYHPSAKVFCSPPLRTACSGSTLISVRAPVGTMNRADQDYCIGRGLGAFLAFPGVADDVFLKHAVEQNISYLDRRSQGSTFLAISANDLETIPLPDFDLPDQQRIAEILSTVDEAIEQTEALIAKTQRIKAGLMHDLFTRGVTPEGRLRPPIEEASHLYKKSLLGWIPKEWEVAEVEEFCSHVVDCPHSTPVYVVRGIPCIRTADMRPGELMIDRAYRVSEATYAARVERLIPRAGDVIYSREGERLGIASPVGNERVCLGQRVMLLRPNSETARSYFLWSMNTPDFYRRVVSGLGATTSPHVNVGDIKKQKLLRPPLQEQVAIGNVLDQSQDGIKSLTMELQKLESTKLAIMYDLLTGRVSVSNPFSKKEAC